ncbi:hypothetical protein GOP47_0022316, partial [Adiantum capillus-veneris]
PFKIFGNKCNTPSICVKFQASYIRLMLRVFVVADAPFGAVDGRFLLQLGRSFEGRLWFGAALLACCSSGAWSRRCGSGRVAMAGATGLQWTGYWFLFLVGGGGPQESSF